MQKSTNDNRPQERGTDADYVSAHNYIADAVKVLRDEGVPRHKIASIFIHEIKSMLDGYKYDDEGGFIADLSILWTVHYMIQEPIKQRTRQVERIQAERARRAELAAQAEQQPPSE